MRLCVLSLFVMLAMGSAAGQPADSLPDRGRSLVASSATFQFYSDLLFNLHDFLVWSARSEQPIESAAECLGGLPEAQQTAYERARDHYEASLSIPGGNRLLLALRYRLAGFGDFGIAVAADIDSTLAVLPPALPAYQACWWPTHDERNRRWISALESLLGEHEEAVSERLTGLLGAELRTPIPVDVVSFGNFNGADSAINPDHILISSSSPANADYAALEVVFHEAAHTIFGPGTQGNVWSALERTALDDGAPLPPDFWHAMLFFTTGSVVQQQLAANGVEYLQYVYSQGLFERSWPAFRGVLEQSWRPYLSGERSLDDSLRLLVAAPKLPERGDTRVASSRRFVFYSDSMSNLHDFLVWSARSEIPPEPAEECLDKLTASQRIAFESAQAHYRTLVSSEGGELVLLSLRWRLAGYGEFRLGDPKRIADAVAAFQSAVPAYEACWWPRHDARNRRWIESLLPLLEGSEGALSERIEAVYGRSLDRWLPVDVVSYSGETGASTVLNPNLIMISSAAGSTAPLAALEAIYSEASYTLFSRRAPGALWQSLYETASAAGKSVPSALPRMILLYTTGRAIQAQIGDLASMSSFQPLLYRDEAQARAFRPYREILEDVWDAYLSGRTSRSEAVRQIIEVLPGE